MKKMLMLTVVIGGLTALVSCKGDHVCSCTATFTGTITGTITTDTTYTDMKKKDADAACIANNDSYDDGTDSYDIVCNLK